MTIRQFQLTIARVILGHKSENNFFKKSEISEVTDTHDAIYVRNDGNCCWVVFETEKRRGDRRVITIGDEWKPKFKLNAFKKYNC